MCNIKELLCGKKAPEAGDKVVFHLEPGQQVPQTYRGREVELLYKCPSGIVEEDAYCRLGG